MWASCVFGVYWVCSDAHAGLVHGCGLYVDFMCIWVCRDVHNGLVQRCGLYVDSMCIGCVVVLMMGLYKDMGCLFNLCVLDV